MLRVTRVRLHNLCQYDDYEVGIEQGLTALCGPNGSGKSCFLRGLAYALTGIVDGSWGTQTDLQKDGTADPGFAEVSFTGDGIDYRIRRFSTSSVKFPDLLVQDTESGPVALATRRAAVNAKMQELLGISVQLMFQICWGRQGQLDAMLTAPAAIINAFLQAVFDMKPLERLREKIQISMGHVAQLPDVSSALAESAKALEQLPQDDPEAEKELSAQVAQLTAEMSQLQASTANGMSKSEHAARLRQLLGQLESYDTWFRQNPRPDVADPGVTADELRQRRTALERTKADTEAKIRKLTGDRESQLRDISVYEKGLEQQQGLFDKRLQMIDKAVNVDRCVLCGGEIADKAAYLANRVKAITGFDTLDRFREDHELSAEGLRGRIAESRASVADSERLLARLEPELADCNGKIAELKALDEAVAAFERARAYDMAKAEQERIRLFVKSLDAVNVYPDDAANMLQDIQGRLAAAQRRLTEVREYRQSLAASRGQLEQAVKTYSRMEEERDLNNEVRRTLGELREVFSQSRAQAIFLRSRIKAINAYIGQYMKHTQMPFSLYLNEDTHVFEYLSAEGYVHPAGHLSGAQKSMSAVVLQMAVLTVVNPSMNLFLIDEPAEALDDNNKVIMAEMFDRMSRLLPAIEGEMLIVTRDPQIIDSSENVIRVGEQQ